MKTGWTLNVHRISNVPNRQKHIRQLLSFERPQPRHRIRAEEFNLYHHGNSDIANIRRTDVHNSILMAQGSFDEGEWSLPALANFGMVGVQISKIVEQTKLVAYDNPEQHFLLNLHGQGRCDVMAMLGLLSSKRISIPQNLEQMIAAAICTKGIVNDVQIPNFNKDIQRLWADNFGSFFRQKLAQNVHFATYKMFKEMYPDCRTTYKTRLNTALYTPSLRLAPGSFDYQQMQRTFSALSKINSDDSCHIADDNGKTLILL